MGKEVPYAVSNWEDVSPFFQFPDEVRRIMYTTNIFEELNRLYRKDTKTKSVFPSDSSLEKMFYLVSLNVVKKWTQRYRNWEQVLNQLTVLYGERLTQYLQKGKSGAAYPERNAAVPILIPIVLPEISILIPEAVCRQNPRKKADGMSYFDTKN